VRKASALDAGCQVEGCFNQTPVLNKSIVITISDAECQKMKNSKGP
jgi:hypothetical protein